MDQERADQSRKVESTGGDKQYSGGATSTSKLDTKGEAEPPPLSTAPGAADGAGQGGAVSSSSDLARKTPPPASASTEPPAAVSDARGAASSLVTAPSSKITMESVRDVLGKFGKKVVEATKQAEDLAGNVWQHLKTGPSIADAAMGRIAQGTKVIAEGGYERIFRQTFDTLPEEQLNKSYACYLSTSAGPVMGILYLSSAKLAFCSDNPLSYKVGDQTEWSYYKVVIPLHQLRQINHSASKANRAEKYIQIISVDNHEFWFMGFVNYDSAVMCLQEALDGSRNEN